MVTKTD
jgi:large subunit ribosomal protein L24e